MSIESWTLSDQNNNNNNSNNNNNNNNNNNDNNNSNKFVIFQALIGLKLVNTYTMM